MAAIHVREIDDAVIGALKARAARNHRSLQGEIRDILETAALEESESETSRGRRKLRIRTVAVGGAVYSPRNDLRLNGFPSIRATSSRRLTRSALARGVCQIGTIEPVKR